MKTKSFVRTAVFATTFAFVAVALFSSCQKDEETSTPQPPAPPQGMYIADTVHYADKGATAYNFVYTSTDPYGEPVQLSAAIVLADIRARVPSDIHSVVTPETDDRFFNLQGQQVQQPAKGIYIRNGRKFVVR